MKDLIIKIINLILSLGIIAIIAVVSIFIWKQLQEVSEAPEVEEFVSKISKTVEDIDVPQIIKSEISGAVDPGEISDEQVDYSNVEVDRFLFNQLNEPEQFIYKAFEENKEAMKTGTAQINFGDFFSNFLRNQNGDTTLLSQYYQTAVEAYTYDNPDVFYIDPNKLYLTVATKTFRSDDTKSYEVYVSNGQAPNYYIDEFNSEQQVNEAIAQVEEVRDYLLSRRSRDTYKNIKMVHDFLVEKAEYDESISKENIYNIYGALVNRVCVCEGYAKSFKYILDAMNIPCVIVVGDGTNSRGETERHAWNYVEYDGEWFAVDTTWDDPIVKGGGEAREQDKTRYFMKKEKDFNKTHNPSYSFTTGGKEFQYPEI